MATSTDRIRRVSARHAGALATLVGITALLVYPLHSPDPSVSGYPPGARAGLVIWPSAIGGSLLVTWGSFSVYDRTLQPLTVRRALLAPLLGVLCMTAGLAHFTYEWIQATPFDVYHASQGGYETVDPSLTEIVVQEFGDLHLASLAVLSGLLVGTITVRWGRRAGLASAALPAAVLGLAFVDPGQQLQTGKLLLFTAGLASVAATLGYLTATPSRSVDPGP